MGFNESEWREAGWDDLEEAKRWYIAGWDDPEEAKRWRDAGWDEGWRAYIWRYEAGWKDPKKAYEWMAGGWGGFTDDYEAYYGVDKEEPEKMEAKDALEWYEYEWDDPEEAYEWYSAGWEGGGWAKEWREAGKQFGLWNPDDYDSPEDAYGNALGWHKADWEPEEIEEIKRWQDAGIFYGEDAMAWRRLAEEGVITGDPVSEALKWKEAGWDNLELASFWYRFGWRNPKEALRWNNAGWGEHRFYELKRLLDPALENLYNPKVQKAREKLEEEIRDALWWKETGWEDTEEAKRWYEHGAVGWGCRPKLALEWYKAGWRDPEEAKEWKWGRQLGWGHPEEALKWKKAGWDKAVLFKEEAYLWYIAGWRDPEEALKWYKAGWSDSEGQKFGNSDILWQAEQALEWYNAGWRDPRKALELYKRGYKYKNPRKALEDYESQQRQQQVPSVSVTNRRNSMRR